MRSDDDDTRPEAAKRLEQARIARGFSTPKEAAEFFGWSYATYHQHEQGVRGLSRAVEKYAVAFKVSAGWLLAGEGKGPDGETVFSPKPVVSVIPGSQLVSDDTMPVYAAAMGGTGHLIVSFDEIDRVKRPRELENVKGGYGLLVVGESMIPAFEDGDTALINPHLPPARDKNVVLYHTPPDGREAEAMVKRMLNWTDREWHLRQYNPPIDFKEFRQEWPICHRVVGRYDGR